MPAGEWRLVCDGVIIDPVDVTFEILWRHEDGSEDTLLASWEQHFDPIGGGVFDAQPCELTAETDVRIDFEPGDQLIYRYSGEGTEVPMAYIPASEGVNVAGRIPHIDLPR